MLRWRLIIEEYGTDIEYIKNEKNIVTDGLSRIPLNKNQETAQKSTYQQKIVSQINDTEEIPEGIFPITLELINKYQWKHPILLDKYK